MHAFAGCNTITFESTNVGSLFSHIRYISRAFRSGSLMNVIGSRTQGAHSQVVVP